MPSARALLLINRKSRSGENSAEEAVRLLESCGMQLTVVDTEKPDTIPQAIAHHADEVDLVIIGGGDGSLNAAAGSLLLHGLPLGILPMGTANDLARTLGIPPVLEEAVRVIAGGRLHRIDLGCVNGVHFFNVANIGLGVTVKHEMSSEAKKRWGVLSYPIGVLAAFRKHRSFRAVIECDGNRVKLHVIQIGVGNGRYYGGGMLVAEDAAIDDNLLSVYALRPAPFWSLVRIAPLFKAGKFDAIDPAVTLRGRRVRIETRRPMQVSTDGEVRTVTPADFFIIPHALQVFVPAAPAGQEETHHADQGRKADRDEPGERVAAPDGRTA